MPGAPIDLGGATFHVRFDHASWTRDLDRASREARAGADKIGRSLDVIHSKLDQNFKSTKFGLGMLAIGQAVDDMQYGLRAIVNNIPQVVYMFGGSGGLAGGIGIAAVAVNQLVEHWGKLSDMMQSRWLNVPAEGLEKIRIRAEKAADAFEKLMKAPSKLQDKQIGILQDVITGADKGGAAMVFKGMTEAVSQEPGLRSEATPREAAEIANLERDIALAKRHNQPRRQQIAEKRLREIRGGIAERNRGIASGIMGQALLGGEEGASGRATMGRLIEKFPGAFTEKFRKAFAGTTEEAVEHADANRAAAQQMMRGPLGTRAMLAGPQAARGPVTMAQAMGLLRQHALLRRLNPRAKEDLAKHLVGMRPEQAAEVMGRMTPAKIEEHAKKMAGGRIGPGAADLMIGTARAVREAGPIAAKPDAVEQMIGAQLKAAGIEGDAPGVRKEMRKLMDDRLKAIMLEKGVTKDQARFLMLREQAQHTVAGFGRPAMSMGIGQFHRFTQLGILSGGGDVAKQQLGALERIEKILKDDLARKNTAVAAGPP